MTLEALLLHVSTIEIMELNLSVSVGCEDIMTSNQVFIV